MLRVSINKREQVRLLFAFTCPLTPEITVVWRNISGSDFVEDRSYLFFISSL